MSDPTRKSAGKPCPPADADVLMETAAVPSGPSSLEETVARQQDQAGETAAPSAGAASEAGSAETRTTNQLGDFKLLKKLGEGGMGAVYKAHQISLDRPVALKVLPKRLASNESFVQRFYREARIAAKLDHPHIVRGYHVGADKGFHYLAMEFVDGGSVQDLLKKHKRFAVGDALHIALACARALEHAHSQNLVHRDVKPDNLLLTRGGVVKLADLGLAKALDDDLSLTQSGVGAGTPYYMAPEQARDAKNVDGRCDIYALGCMLYVFLTGEFPFKGTTTLEVVQAKEEGKFPPVRRLNPEVPEQLDLMIDKMLAKKPEHRYQSCSEVIKDLQGLGLASATLTVFSAARGESTVTKSADATSLLTRPSATPQAAKGHVKPSPDTEPADAWFVRYRGPDGKLVTRKMTTHQVNELIKEPAFDIKAEASRSRDGVYRGLGTYKEFEHGLRARLTLAKAKRKTEKFQHFYDKLEAEDRSRRRWRWFRDLFRGTIGWITLAGFVVILLGAGYLVWQLDVLGTIGQWFKAKLGL